MSEKKETIQLKKEQVFAVVDSGLRKSMKRNNDDKVVGERSN
jgi:hypothetical protein